MFSTEEKKKLAKAIEKLLLDLKHPEMPTEKLKFKLHVDGKENWSWADIGPNWVFEDGKEMGVNPFNEQVRKNKKMEAKIYNSDESEEHQIDIQHKFHDSIETFETYECPECKGHFLVEGDAMDSVDIMYCPYCKKEFGKEDA